MLESWGLKVGRAWRAGQPRTTPRGAALRGVWPDSYGYVSLLFPAEARLAECLDHVLDGVEPFSQEIARFVETGGYAELFVGWHFENNSGDELGWRTLRRLADYRLALSFDIYPDRDWLEEIEDGEA